MYLRICLFAALLCLMQGSLLAQNVRQAHFLSTNSPGATSLVAFKGYAGQPVISATSNSESNVAFVPSYVRVVRQLTIEIPSGAEQPVVVPFEFGMGQNFPNPFNPSTVIPFTLDKNAPSSLAIFNLLGQKVREFDLSGFSVGEYELTWDGKNTYGMSVPSGQYFARLSHDSRMQVRKLTLIK